MDEKTFNIKIKSSGKVLEIKGFEIGTYGGSIAVYRKRHGEVGEYLEMVFVAPSAHFEVA